LPDHIVELFSDCPKKMKFAGFKKYLVKKMKAELWIINGLINFLAFPFGKFRSAK